MDVSARAAFPVLWDVEDRGNGSVVRGLLMRDKSREDGEDGYVLGDVGDAMDGVAVYSFKDGIGTLTDALVRELRRNPNVQLQSGVGATSLRLNPHTNTFEVRFPFLPHPDI
jgi:oxygen-dependent protoporphyrinogen oxidase